MSYRPTSPPNLNVDLPGLIRWVDYELRTISYALEPFDNDGTLYVTNIDVSGSIQNDTDLKMEIAGNQIVYTDGSGVVIGLSGAGEDVGALDWQRPALVVLPSGSADCGITVEKGPFNDRPGIAFVADEDDVDYGDFSYDLGDQNFVFDVESSTAMTVGAGALSLITGATATASINFNDGANAGIIEYDHNVNELALTVNAVETFWLDGTDMCLGVSASGTTRTNSGFSTFHIGYGSTNGGVIEMSKDNTIRGRLFTDDDDVFLVSQQTGGSIYLGSGGSQAAWLGPSSLSGILGLGLGGGFSSAAKPDGVLEVTGGPSIFENNTSTNTATLQFKPRATTYTGIMEYLDGSGNEVFQTSYLDSAESFLLRFGANRAGLDEIFQFFSTGEIRWVDNLLTTGGIVETTVNPNSTNWYRLSSLTSSNRGQYSEFILAIPFQHVWAHVKHYKTTGINSAAGGGGVVEVTIFGTYSYGNFHPYDWRLSDGGAANQASYLDIRFPNGTSVGATTVYIIPLAGCAGSTSASDLPSLGMTSQGSGTNGGHYMNMGSGSGAGFTAHIGIMHEHSGYAAYKDFYGLWTRTTTSTA